MKKPRRYHPDCRECKVAGLMLCPVSGSCERGLSMKFIDGHLSIVVRQVDKISIKVHGVWAKAGRYVHIRCPSCSWTNKVACLDVGDGGTVNLDKYTNHRKCVTCSGCGIHFYPYLQGWKKEEFHA